MNTRSMAQVENVSKTFRIAPKKNLVAVSNVSLNIAEGEVLGLVGESGCGKTTLGRIFAKLHLENSGKVFLDGENISGEVSGSRRKVLSRKVQMIFQDPYSSLNPRMTVQDIIAEGPDAHGLWTTKERRDRVSYWLAQVGLHKSHMSRYPHEFSGGQRQRIGIARALALEPKFVVCDEPISALDVSVQAQIVHLLRDLQSSLKLTYLFIAHDLSMVRVISDRMAVMYLGHVVELGTAKEIYENPQHPYTKALIAANPIPDPAVERKRNHAVLKGEVSSPVNPKPGCPFVSRCPLAIAKCQEVTPILAPMGTSRHVACHVVN